MKISNQNRMLERLIDRFDKKIDGGKGRMNVFDMKTVWAMIDSAIMAKGKEGQQ